MSTSESLALLLDIPHILGSICDHLDSKTIWECARVSRTWSRLFRPHHWRNVSIVESLFDDHCVFLNGQTIEPIKEKAYRIRQLRISSIQATTLLGMIPCTRLERLELEDVDFVAPWADEDVNIVSEGEGDEVLDSGRVNDIIKQDEKENEAEGQDMALIHAVQRNPRLKDLTVSVGFQSAGDPLLASFLGWKTLSNHSSIERLHFSFEKIAHGKILPMLLCNLPKPLKTLQIEWASLPEPDGSFVGFTSMRNLGLEDFPPYAHLEELRLQHYGHRFGARMIRSVLIPFLQRCPRLQLIKLPRLAENQVKPLATTLALYCPDLKSIVWSAREYVATHYGAIDILEPLKGLALRDLEVYVTSRSQVQYVETVAKHFGSTLETLKILAATNIRKGNVISGLTLFPKLTCLHITILDEYKAQALGVSLEELVRVEWGCSELESFHLVMVDQRLDSHCETGTDEEFDDVDEHRIAAKLDNMWLVGQLHRKLRALPKLVELKILWQHYTLVDCKRWHLFIGVRQREWLRQEGMSDEDLEWMNIRLVQ